MTETQPIRAPGRQQQFVVSYDVSCDKERRNVDRLLSGWGHRAQKSVFTITTTRYGMRQLLAALEKLALKTGTVLVFRLQQPARPQVIGQPYHDPDQEIAYIV